MPQEHAGPGPSAHEKFQSMLDNAKVPEWIGVGDDVPVARRRAGVYQRWMVTEADASKPTVTAVDQSQRIQRDVPREEIMRLRKLAAIGALPPDPGVTYSLNPPQDMLEWGTRLAGLVVKGVPPTPGGRMLNEDEIDLIPYRGDDDVAVLGQRGLEPWKVSGIMQDGDGELGVVVRTERPGPNGQTIERSRTVPIAELTFYQHKQQNAEDFERVSARTE